MLTNAIIQNFVAQVELFAKDQLYGSNDCTMTLDELWGQMMAIMCLSNPCLTVSQAQQLCFNSFLTQKPC